MCEIYSQCDSSICVTKIAHSRIEKTESSLAIMADATAADEEPDAHEIMLHAVISLRQLTAYIKHLTVHWATKPAAHDVDNSSENDSAALRRFFQFDNDGTVEFVAAVIALLGSDLAVPVAAASSQRRSNVERGALGPAHAWRATTLTTSQYTALLPPLPHAAACLPACCASR